MLQALKLQKEEGILSLRITIQNCCLQVLAI